MTLDIVTPERVSLPGDHGTEEAAGNFLVIKAAMSQRLSAAECSDLIFEYRKLDLTSRINHYLSISEWRHILQKPPALRSC